MRALAATMALASLVAGGGASAEGLFMACDNGLRCVTAPCPSTNVRDLLSGETLPGVYVDASRLPPDEADLAEKSQAFYGGSLAFEGALEKRDLEIRGGRVRTLYLVVTHIARRSKPAERRMCRAVRGRPSLR